MEKLEKKIEDLMHNSVWKLLPPEKYLPLIASEVQDIAIAFAKWESNLPLNKREKPHHKKDGSWTYVNIPDTALFTEFIKQYYK